LALENIDGDGLELVVAEIEALKPCNLSTFEDGLRHLGQVVVGEVEQEPDQSGEGVALQLRDGVVTQVNFLQLARILESSFADLAHLVPAQIDLPEFWQICKVSVINRFDQVSTQIESFQLKQSANELCREEAELVAGEVNKSQVWMVRKRLRVKVGQLVVAHVQGVEVGLVARVGEEVAAIRAHPVPGQVKFL